MSYQVYTTEALVCESFLRNTADKTFLLFTREAGMLYATAKSVREERSKQRFALQDFALIRISLIKGKQGWRVGSVEGRNNYFTEAEDRLARGSVVLIFKTLRRFIHGEEAMKGLFDFCIEALNELTRNTDQRPFLEVITQLKILFELGYVDKDDTLSGLEKGTYVEVLQSQHNVSLEKIEQIIKKGVENSHL